jgi:hypothetical protein
VTAEGHDAAAGPPDVPEQQLQQRRRADHLDAVGVLGPGDGVAERRRSLRAGVGGQRLGDFQEGLLWAAGDALDHLRCVPREVPPNDLEDAARVLERLVTLGRWLEQRPHQVVIGRPRWRGLGLALLTWLALLAGRDRLLAGLGRRRRAALIAHLGLLVLPGLVVVLAQEAVDRIAGVLHQAGEDAVQILGVLEAVLDDG